MNMNNQPDMWLWVAPHGEASEVSFHSREDAIGDAQRHARGDVDRYSVDVFEHPKISEDELADYFAAQIEDGRISPSEVAVKLARYGLMDPSEFAMEMQERIEMAKEECVIDYAPKGEAA
jgi:hypothetical protein